MKIIWIRKWLEVGIILLFIGTCIILAIAQDTEKSLPISRGNWLYVGGDGSGNYTTIQDAIDNTTDGDTIFVYSGFYNESIVIYKSIIVSGENRNTTFIVGDDKKHTIVLIEAIAVEFRGFNIQAQPHTYKNGIVIRNSSYSKIQQNYVSNYEWGIWVYNSKSVIVSNNTIQNCTFGIVCYQTKKVKIKGNIIGGTGDGYGIEFDRTIKNSIERNTMMNNDHGIDFFSAFFTSVKENNFLENRVQVSFGNSFFSVWHGNYWNESLLSPKVLFGYVVVGLFRQIQIINVDWHPAQEPYDIGG